MDGGNPLKTGMNKGRFGTVGLRRLFSHFLGEQKVTRRRNSGHGKNNIFKTYLFKMEAKDTPPNSCLTPRASCLTQEQRKELTMPTSINLYTLKQHRITRYRYDLDLQVTNPKTCHHLLDLLLGLKREPVEKFGILSLNTKYKVTGLHIVKM